MDMPLNKIHKILRSYGLSETQIEKFDGYYSHAKKQKILYPFYYAFTKTMI